MDNKNYGLIFDVDGVIADSERVNAQATIKVFAELFATHGVQRQDFEAGLGRGAEAYVRSAAEIHGLELTDQQVAAASEARQINFLNLLSQETLAPFPGVVVFPFSNHSITNVGNNNQLNQIHGIFCARILLRYLVLTLLHFQQLQLSAVILLQGL